MTQPLDATLAADGRFPETDEAGCDDTAPGLTPPEAAAIGALMSSRTLEAAAEQCGVPARSLRRWLTDRPGFRAALRREQRAAMACVTARLQQGAAKALDTLESVMDDSKAPASARVSAARALLEQRARAHRRGGADRAARSPRATSKGGSVMTSLRMLMARIERVEASHQRPRGPVAHLSNAELRDILLAHAVEIEAQGATGEAQETREFALASFALIERCEALLRGEAVAP